jgi:hypothetical protein
MERKRGGFALMGLLAAAALIGGCSGVFVKSRQSGIGRLREVKTKKARRKPRLFHADRRTGGCGICASDQAGVLIYLQDSTIDFGGKYGTRRAF